MALVFQIFLSIWPSLLTAQFRIVYVPLGESVKLQVPKTNPQENEIQKYNFCCFCCNFIRNCRRLCSLICREQYKRHVFEKMSLLQATTRNCTFFRMNKMLLWQFLLINPKVETGLTWKYFGNFLWTLFEKNKHLSVNDRLCRKSVRPPQKQADFAKSNFKQAICPFQQFDKAATV